MSYLLKSPGLLAACLCKEAGIAKIPDTKPSLGSKPIDALDPNNPDETWQAKLDGGFVYYLVEPSGVRAFSWRKSKLTGKPIEHTDKIHGIKDVMPPKWLQGAVLQGEAWHPGLSSREVGGIMNSRKQPYTGALQGALHGIAYLPGQPLEEVTERQKQKLIKDVARALPFLELPDTAVTPEEKKQLLHSIQRREHPQTSEGIVVYPTEGSPYKAVITPTYDAPVVGYTAGQGKYENNGIGALLVGNPENPTRVGTGLSDNLRHLLWKNPKLLDGMVAKLTAKEIFPSGKYRAPAFKEFHPEKSDPVAMDALLEKLKSYGFQKQAVIRRVGSKYKLYTHDGKKVLGTHNTREGALRQERAIQMAKHGQEFAPGIPMARRIHKIPESSNKDWEFSVQHHKADRAGEHYDLRLADPITGHAHSWALPKATLPTDEKRVRLAVQQPTHTLDYIDYTGEIPKGTYGAGQVDIAYRGKTKVDSSADRIAFEIPGQGNFVLRKKDGNNWMMIKKKASVLETPGVFSKSAAFVEKQANMKALLGALALSPLIGAGTGVYKQPQMPITSITSGGMGGATGGAIGGLSGLGLALLLQILMRKGIDINQLLAASTAGTLGGAALGGIEGATGAAGLTGTQRDALLEEILEEIQKQTPEDQRAWQPDLLR